MIIITLTHCRGRTHATEFRCRKTGRRLKSLGLVLLAAKWRPHRQDEPARPEAADGRFGHAGVTSCCIGLKQLPDGRVSPTAATHDGGRYGTLGAEQKRSQESRTALGARGVADATQAGSSKRDDRGLRGSAGGVRVPE